mmetsp:Transcript_76570/g.155424  ORF Transcript_76570/g.155424 Transcript_76570/m.155424 type:complete len:142 (-) Transcript_76570:82-507(-)
MVSFDVLFVAAAPISLWVTWSMCSGWATKLLVKKLIGRMSTKDKGEMLLFLMGLVKYVEHGEHDDDDGEWSVVSDVSPTPEDFSRCQHVRTTWRGSNQYQRRLVCKDCGQILFLTKAPKKKITKKNPPNEYDFIMVISVSA